MVCSIEIMTEKMPIGLFRNMLDKLKCPAPRIQNRYIKYSTNEFLHNTLQLSNTVLLWLMAYLSIFCRKGNYILFELKEHNQVLFRKYVS